MVRFNVNYITTGLVLLLPVTLYTLIGSAHVYVYFTGILAALPWLVNHRNAALVIWSALITAWWGVPNIVIFNCGVWTVVALIMVECFWPLEN